MATICARCVLPESRPDIWLDHEGVCNICRVEESCDPSTGEKPLLETDFVRILNQHRGRHRYDCMVMCSGGKDSTASLYYMTRRYRLKVLAFTFDHGFETEEAMENVKKAVEKLGVDFLYFKTGYMKRMFAKMIATKSKAVICHPCSIWYMGLAFDVAARNDIPIIVAGWTKGQSTRKDVMTKCACNIDSPEYASMSKATERFLETLKDDPEYRKFPRTMEEVLHRANRVHKALVLSPHWFLNTHPDEYVELISRELDWRYPKLSYPGKSTNCYMNFVSVYLSMKYYGYTHYHVEASKMVRMGILTREEALGLLKIDFDKSLIEKIVAGLGIEID